jgi:hypothetical protein
MTFGVRSLSLVAGSFLMLGACTSVLGQFDAQGSGGSGGGTVLGECAAPSDCTLGELDETCAKVDCSNEQCLVTLSPKGSECGDMKGRCDGAGHCRECLDDNDCAKGTCIEGLCSEKVLGEVCGDAQQCASGFCAFGLCCDRECVGACEACNLPGKEGSCQVAPLGSVGEPACAPFLCDGANGSCPKECTSNDQCVEGRYCEPATKGCELKKDNAASCTDDAMCKSGECYQGTEPTARCCSTACACGTCATGQCVVTASPGSDPKAECGTGTCDGLVGCSTKGEPLFVFGLVGTGTIITPSDVAVDASGNTYVGGMFTGTLTPNGKTVTSLGYDGFVLKLTKTGDLEWFLRVGEKAGNAIQSVTGITIDEDGTALIVGNFTESIALGATTTSTASPSIFVARLEPNGKVLSSAPFKLADASGSASALAIDRDEKGNVFIGGSFAGKFTFTKPLFSAGETDGFVAKLEGGTFKPLTDLRLGGPGVDVVNSIDLGPSNVLAIGGRIGGNATFAKKSFVNQGSSDAFVVLATVGPASIIEKSAAVYGSSGFDEVRSVVQASDGNVYLGGSVTGGVDFSDPIIAPPTLADDSDPFIVGLTGTLTHLWTQRYASTSVSATQRLALDSAGFVVSVGKFAGTMTPTLGMTLTSHGGTDGWLLKHHPGGQNPFGGKPIWSVTPSVGLSTDIVNAVTTTQERDIVVAGSYGGEYAFAGKALPGAGYKDSALFVARLRQ